MSMGKNLHLWTKVMLEREWSIVNKLIQSFPPEEQITQDLLALRYANEIAQVSLHGFSEKQNICDLRKEKL